MAFQTTNTDKLNQISVNAANAVAAQAGRGTPAPGPAEAAEAHARWIESQAARVAADVRNLKP